jgi:hypothetical protein
MNDAYNSDDNELWCNFREDMECPANSMESTEQIDFQSSSDDEVVMGEIDEDHTQTV